MRGMRRKFVLSLTIAFLAAIFANADTGTATVGDLLIGVAGVKDLETRDAASAKRALAEAGMPVSSLSVSKTLTEADVAEMLATIGVRVRTTRPDRTVSAEVLAMMISALGPEIAGPARAGRPGRDAAYDNGPYPRPNDQAADPATKGKKRGSSKGKGKKKGHGPVSPSCPI